MLELKYRVVYTRIASRGQHIYARFAPRVEILCGGFWHAGLALRLLFPDWRSLFGLAACGFRSAGRIHARMQQRLERRDVLGQHHYESPVADAAG